MKNVKKVSIFNFITAGYFLILILVDKFKIGFALIGFLRELLTIPFLLLMIVLLVYDFKLIVFDKKKSVLLTVSTFILMIFAVIIAYKTYNSYG